MFEKQKKTIRNLTGSICNFKSWKAQFQATDRYNYEQYYKTRRIRSDLDLFSVTLLLNEIEIHR